MNRALLTTVKTIGVIFGFSGMTHGFFETLQGNTPTGGLFINAIAAGSTWTRWVDGSEGAFTLVPNFLITGILAMLVGAAIIVWSLWFVDKACGPLVFLLLYLTLFLVGGGIGQVPFFVLAWAFATRVHKPLEGWQRMLSPGLQNRLSRAWPWLLIGASTLILVGLTVGIFGYVPGLQDMARVLNLTLSLVGASWLLFLLAFVAGVARDLQSVLPMPSIRSKPAAAQQTPKVKV